MKDVIFFMAEFYPLNLTTDLIGAFILVGAEYRYGLKRSRSGKPGPRNGELLILLN